MDPASHRARQELAKEAARARERAAAETPEDLEDLEDRETTEDSDTLASASQPREVQRAGVSARAPGPATLRLEAEEAMRRRNFSGAAGHYEDLLRLLGPRDRAAATVRLDLALLYYRQLGDERRAIEHLTYFADTWPDDMAAPIAISELCRLLGESRAQSDHCGGR